MSNVTSYYAKKVDRTEARARLLRGSLEEVERLERAVAKGWDCQVELDRARAYVAAFSGPAK
jgi:hypothetical protein